MIVGIDPGSTGVAGIAVVNEQGTGCWSIKMPKEPAEGLVLVRKTLLGLVGDHPDAGTMVVHEGVITQRTSSAATNFLGNVVPLARVEGVIYEVCATAGVVRVSVHPKTLKAAFGIKGRGKEGKQQMIAAMRELGHSPNNEHEADALACCEWLLRHSTRS